MSSYEEFAANPDERTHLLDDDLRPSIRQKIKLAILNLIGNCTQFKNINIAVLTILIYCIFSITWLSIAKVGRLPAQTHSLRDTQIYGKFSADSAINSLRDAHMFNSDANHRVREFLIQQIVELQNLASSVGRHDNILLELDNVNYVSFRNWNFESNNILVRVKGYRSLANLGNETLLISAHFDSTPVSHGVTDDGIGIVCMLESIRSLIYSPIQQYDIIYNFNNAEELGLLGGTAFLLHPWSKDVKAFINLEGTGSAGSMRSMLFRTNSFALVQDYKQGAPFPHASVLFNDLIQYVQSETDYRPYVSLGKLPGVDIAFYTYRYLYHTPRDDIEHVNPLSVQHMGDNLLGMIKVTCGNDSKSFDQFDKINPIDKDKDPIHSPLPSSGFVFYDLMGRVMVVTSHSLYFYTMLVLLLVVTATAFVKSYLAALQSRWHCLTLYAIPYLKNVVVVYCCVLLPLGAIVMLSSVKAWFNPGSSYGNPELNLIWMLPLILLCYIACISAPATPLISENASGTSSSVLFHQLPIEINDERSDDILSNYRIVRATPDDWLVYGLLSFWYTLEIGVISLSGNGLDGPFFLTSWFAASAFTAMITLAMRTKICEFWRDELNGLEIAVWKKRVIIFHDEYFWAVQIFASTFLPFLVTIDLLEQALSSLPSIIAEGLSELRYDVVMAMLLILLSINILPAFRAITKRKVLGCTLLAIFLVAYLLACTFYPFTPDRPHKMRFEQVWDIITNESAEMGSTVTLQSLNTMDNTRANALLKKSMPWLPEPIMCNSVACTYNHMDTPLLGQDIIANSSAAGDLINITFGKPAFGYLTGKVIGSFGSRVCMLDVQGYPHRKDDKAFGIWLEYENSTRWNTINGESPNPFNTSTSFGVEIEQPAVMLRRAYDLVDGKGRIEFTFLLRFDQELWEISLPTMSIIVRCYHGETIVSSVYERMVREMPAYLSFAHGRFGGSIVQKRARPE